MNSQLFAILIAAAIFLLVLNLIRRQKMTFKYSMAWLSACSIVLVFSIKPDWLFSLSKLAGFQLPSNFVFFCLLVFFVCLTLLLTVYINEQNNRGESLAQSVSLLEYRIRKMEEEKKEKDRNQ